ncbi:MAG: hypothetical protein JNN29_07195 [Chitinophagaceae bacterium]|nr:hypothetical protein [Chitinophagaceae bacterium]MBN8668608.1 hypothetical protein [Chitinophagales bacterium]
MSSLRLQLFGILLTLSSLSSYAQDEDLLSLVGDDKPKKEHVDYAFKSSRVIMSQSMELIRPGVMDFRILHRFGSIDKGAYEMFGLDNATMRMGLDFGITKNFMLGVGRSTNKKEFDGFLKYRLVHQSKNGGLPFSVVVVAGGTLNSLKWADTTRKNFFTSRMAYYGQIIIGSKLSEAITLQVTPTVLHRNLVPDFADPSDLIAVGVGGRIRLSNRISLTADYLYRVNPNEADGTRDPLSIGFDIETGGHVFQLHFSNALGMNERSFLTETTGQWGKGEIQFGFNIMRAFQINKKEKKNK